MGKFALTCLGVALATALAAALGAAHAMNKNDLITSPPAGGVELTRPYPPEPPPDTKSTPKKDAKRVPPPVKTPAPRPSLPAPAGKESK